MLRTSRPASTTGCRARHPGHAATYIHYYTYTCTCTITCTPHLRCTAQVLLCVHPICCSTPCGVYQHTGDVVVCCTIPWHRTPAVYSTMPSYTYSGWMHPLHVCTTMLQYTLQVYSTMPSVWVHPLPVCMHLCIHHYHGTVHTVVYSTMHRYSGML